jgi:hypothetical protein
MDLGNNYNLRRYSLLDGSIETLATDRVEAYNVGNGVIIYQKYSQTNPELIKMNDDGSNPVVIAPGNYWKINFTSQFAYFQAFDNETVTQRVPLYGEPVVNVFTAARNAVAP